ncbi:DJ-1/PfpI family protein [Nocardia goodfellowii]
MQIAVLVYPGMTALDAVGPYEALRFIPGAIVRFVWHRPGPVLADSGVLALGATHSLAETPKPDIVVVPGGPAAIVVAADPAVLAWLRRVHENTQWTTSVCTGALILAAAGLLDDKPATTHWAAQRALAQLGARPQRDQRIVRSGRIATAAGVSAGIDLALWLIGELCGPERAQAVQLDIEYDPRPPYDAGHPDKASPAVRRLALSDQLKLVPTSGMVAEIACSLPVVLWGNILRRIRGRHAKPIEVAAHEP